MQLILLALLLAAVPALPAQQTVPVGGLILGQPSSGSSSGTGTQGPPGAAATVAVGTTTTAAAGSSATVTNSGSSNAATFNFTIPQGAQGIQGIQGTQGIQGIQGVKGDIGLKGDTGATGAPGSGSGSTPNTQTAGAGGVTASTLVTEDTSAPTRFITASLGKCGAGIAGSTVAAGATFTLQDLNSGAPVNVLVDAAGATAGHFLIGSTTTAGTVKDGGTDSTAISVTSSICGVALANASGSGTVSMLPRGRGSPGRKVDSLNGGAVPTTPGLALFDTNGRPQYIRPMYQMYGFWDSFITNQVGYGPTNAQRTGLFARLANDTPTATGQQFNFGVGGATCPVISGKLFANYAPNPQYPSLVHLGCGENETATESALGCTNGATSACTLGFTAALDAAEVFATLPTRDSTNTYVLRQMASLASKTGTCAANTNIALFVSSILASPGTAMACTTAGATLTFTVTSPVATTNAGLTYGVTNNVTATFTAKADGTVDLLNPCNGTTTLTSGPCTTTLPGGNTNAWDRVQATGLPSSTTHTIVVTVGASPSSQSIFGWADTIPGVPVSNTNAAFVWGVISAYDSTGVYNTASANLTAARQAMGLPLYFVDVRSTSTAADISSTATMVNPATTGANHWNDGGILNAIKTFTATENANNFWVSVPGGGRQNVVVPHTVTSASAPALLATYQLETITLAQNATPSVSGIVQGDNYTLQICQNATGGYTWTPPALMRGAITSATIAAMAANTCAVQTFVSYNGNTLVATGPGVTGIAP